MDSAIPDYLAEDIMVTAVLFEPTSTQLFIKSDDVDFRKIKKIYLQGRKKFVKNSATTPPLIKPCISIKDKLFYDAIDRFRVNQSNNFIRNQSLINRRCENLLHEMSSKEYSAPVEARIRKPTLPIRSVNHRMSQSFTANHRKVIDSVLLTESALLANAKRPSIGAVEIQELTIPYLPPVSIRQNNSKTIQIFALCAIFLHRLKLFHDCVIIEKRSDTISQQWKHFGLLLKNKDKYNGLICFTEAVNSLDEDSKKFLCFFKVNDAAFYCMYESPTIVTTIEAIKHLSWSSSVG